MHDWPSHSSKLFESKYYPHRFAYSDAGLLRVKSLESNKQAKAKQQ